MVVFTAKSQQYFHAVFDINAASWFSQSLKNLYSFLYLPHYFFSNRNREIAPTFCRGNLHLIGVFLFSALSPKLEPGDHTTLLEPLQALPNKILASQAGASLRRQDYINIYKYCQYKFIHQRSSSIKRQFPHFTARCARPSLDKESLCPLSKNQAQRNSEPFELPELIPSKKQLISQKLRRMQSDTINHLFTNFIKQT